MGPWLSLALAAVLAPQDAGERWQTFRFEVDVSLVLLNVVVTDGGRYVEGLEQDDFQLYEDSRPQEISYFSWEGPQPEEQDLPSGDDQTVRYVRRLRGHSSRVVFIVFDTVGDLGNYSRSRSGARSFLERLAGPDDRVGLVFFSDFWRARVVEPTLDRDFLAEEIRRPRITSFYQSDRDFGRTPGHSIYRQLKYLIESVRTLQGRKIFVLVSEGLPLVDESDQRWLFSELTDTIDEANEKDITIYTVDPSGLSAPGPGGVVRSAFLANQGSSELARRTGGLALYNHNEMARAFEMIDRDTRLFYTLGYMPRSDEGPARWRRIRVEVVGHPEYEVRTRTGYFAGF
jgi:VWFA-related protein